MTRTGKKRISYRILLVKYEGKTNLNNLGVDDSIIVAYVLMRMASV
jgi:hypothetical protein